MTKDLARLFAAPFLDAYRRVSNCVASLVAALVLLLLGMFTARLARVLIEAALNRIRLDEHTSRFGLNELLARLGLGKSPTAVAAFAVHWFILVVFVLSAANILDLPAVSELLERFAQFLPTLVAAALILFGGLLFGRLVSQVLASAAAANSIRGGQGAATGAYVVIVGYASMTALEQLGARPQLVMSVAEIFLGSVGLALAIAFGLGAKDLAAEWLRRRLERKP